MKQRDVNFITRQIQKGTPRQKIINFLQGSYSDDEIAKFMPAEDDAPAPADEPAEVPAEAEPEPEKEAESKGRTRGKNKTAEG